MSTKKRDDPIRQTFLKLEDAVNDASKAQMKAQRPYTVSELERYLNQIEPLLDVHVAAQETKATSKSFVDTDAALTNEQLGERYVKFEAWLRSVAPSSLVGDAFTFATGLKEGSGVIAARDLSEDELFMVIPRKAMLTFETALKSPFGPVIQRDARLTKLHPLATAMHLLFEKLAGETSFWAPYLAILPASYPTPLFARVSEFAALRGSPSYGSALQMVATLIRQYTEMTRLHMTTVCDTNLPNFSFREFRWAVANVMARQNKILSSAYVPMPGAVPITTVALIPGFDSLNHAPAADDAITTSFDWQAQASESFVHVPVKKGDQIYINYESRPNSLLLMYQGFIVAEGGNPNDRVLIRGVQLDLTDPIAKVKGLLLTKLGLLHSEIAIPFLPPTPVSSAETEDASVSGGVVPVPPPYAPLQRWRDVWRLLAVLSMDKAAVSKSLLDLTKATKEAGADGAAVLASGDPTALLSVLKATGTALAQDEPPAEMKEVVYKALLQVLEQSASTAAAAAADGAAVTKVVREGKETEFMALAKALVKGEQELIKKQIELAKEGKAY